MHTYFYLYVHPPISILHPRLRVTDQSPMHSGVLPPPLLPFSLNTFTPANRVTTFTTPPALPWAPSTPPVDLLPTSSQPTPTPVLLSYFPDMPPIPAKLIQKIINKEFVDLTLLLPDQLQASIAPSGSCSDTSVVILPSTAWDTQRRKRRQIGDIATWVQLFSIYMLILASAHPGDIPKLVAYQLLIVKHAKKFKYPSWLHYDIEFRKFAAITKSTEWACVNPEIFALAFTNQGIQSQWCPACGVDEGLHTYDCPEAPTTSTSGTGGSKANFVPKKAPNQQTSAQLVVDYCLQFNYAKDGCRFGPRCKYPHRCAMCKLFGHPQSMCNTRKPRTIP